MNNSKYFGIYKDFVVREFDDIPAENHIDLLGVLKYEETGEKFYPFFFSKSKQGKSVEIWRFSMDKEIQLNSFFKIINVFESKDEDQHRRYYRELSIALEDISGESKKFKFNHDPEFIFNYLDIQKYLNKIFDELSGTKTFEAANIKKELDKVCKVVESKIDEIEKLKLQLRNIENKAPG